MGHFSGVGSWNFGFSLEYLGTVHAVHAVDIGRRLMNIYVVSIIFFLSLSLEFVMLFSSSHIHFSAESYCSLSVSLF